MDKIADYINDTIQRKGIRQKHLCGLVGISQTRLSLFLKNQGGMHPSDLIRLMLALDFKIITPSGTQVTLPPHVPPTNTETSPKTTETPQETA